MTCRERPDALWPSDSTYIRTREGWSCLCGVLDIRTTRIVGWRLTSHMRRSLVTDALEMVLSARQEHEDSLIARSDNGSAYARLLEGAYAERGIAHYLSYPHGLKQNAWVERVIRTAQDELSLHDETPVSLDEHAESLVWLDRDYNEVRPHRSLGYLTPSEYDERKVCPQGATR